MAYKSSNLVPAAQTALNNMLPSGLGRFTPIGRSTITPQMSTAPQMSIATPAGVRATYAGSTPIASRLTTPAASPAPAPAAQPLATVQTPSPQPAAQPAAPTVPQTQYNAQGQSIGTQHPGMAGFSPTVPTPGLVPGYPVQTSQRVQQGGTAQTTPTTSTQTTQDTGQSTTFPGLVGGLVSAAQTAPSAVAPEVAGLMGTAAQNLATSGPAYQDYQSSINDLNTLKQQYAQFQAGIGSQPGTPFAIRAGEQAQIQEQFQEQLDAAQQKVNEKQAVIEQGLEAARIQQAGFQQAGTLAQTGQGQVLSGLGAATTAAQPQLGAYGQTYYYPTGGTTGGAGEVQPSDPFYQTLTQYANMAASGQLSQIPSSITSNPVLNAQLNRMAQQINPNYSPVLSVASAQTQATGQQAAAAAPAAYQALDALQTAYDNLPDLAKGTIPGIGLNVPWIQGLAQGAATGTGIGRPEVSAFQGALKEARAQVDAVLAPIIGVDAANAQASALLPDNMQPTELPQKIGAAKTYIQQRISSYQASGQMAGAPSVQQSTPSSSGWDSIKY